MQLLNAEINKELDSAEGCAALQRVGVDGDPMSVQALQELIARDEKRPGDLVRSAGSKAN